MDAIEYMEMNDEEEKYEPLLSKIMADGIQNVDDLKNEAQKLNGLGKY